MSDEYNNKNRERVKSPRIPTDRQSYFLSPAIISKANVQEEPAKQAELREQARQEELAEQERLREQARQEKLAEQERLREQARQEELAEQERLREQARQEELAEQERRREQVRQEELAEQERRREQARQEKLAEQNKQNTKDNRESSSKTLVHIGIILDATYSFSYVFPGVFIILKEFTDRMKTNKKEYSAVDFKYGLTVLHDQAKSIMFGSDEFTSSEDVFMNKLKSIEFSGGHEDGKENLCDAIFEQLKSFSTYKDFDKDHKGESKYWRVYDGLIMLTDSLPMDDAMTPDFSREKLSNGIDDSINNNGLRFAQFYAFNDKFNPIMRMVDRDGKQTEENKNSVVYSDIHELLNGDLEKAIAKVEKMIDCIIQQTSVGA